MQDFRELKVWQKARQLVCHCYRATGKFPREEIYGLTSQARRAAVSISSNIAEGRGYGTDKVFAKYLRTSMASAYELENYAILAADLSFISAEESERLSAEISEVRRMINGLLQTLGKGDESTE